MRSPSTLLRNQPTHQLNGRGYGTTWRKTTFLEIIQPFYVLERIFFDSRKPGKQKEAKIKARTAMSCLAKLVQATEGLAKVEEILIENKVFAWHWNWFHLPGEDALYFVSMDISETFNVSCLFDEILALIKFACLVAAELRMLAASACTRHGPACLEKSRWCIPS